MRARRREGRWERGGGASGARTLFLSCKRGYREEDDKKRERKEGREREFPSPVCALKGARKRERIKKGRGGDWFSLQCKNFHHKREREREREREKCR